jgi:hypothetical protein
MTPSKTTRSKKIPAAMQTHWDTIKSLIHPYCQVTLNSEYKELAELALAALCRKKPSPLLRGQPTIWACAILHALGTINFLFDKTNTPYVPVSALCEAFDVAASTITNKSRQIREMLHMNPWDYHWLLPSRLQDSPFIWMITIDGFIIDVRTASRDIQLLALKKGLIPFLPNDCHEP